MLLTITEAFVDMKSRPSMAFEYILTSNERQREVPKNQRRARPIERAIATPRSRVLQGRNEAI